MRNQDIIIELFFTLTHILSVQNSGFVNTVGGIGISTIISIDIFVMVYPTNNLVKTDKLRILLLRDEIYLCLFGKRGLENPELT